MIIEDVLLLLLIVLEDVWQVDRGPILFFGQLGEMAGVKQEFGEKVTLIVTFAIGKKMKPTKV